MTEINWCVLGDCFHPECHHCYPVKNCSKNHDYCIENGTCPEIFLSTELKVLVTGCAGFIGSHVSEYLLKRGNKVLGIDNINDYYDTKIKQKNIEILQKYTNFEFRKEDICETNSISQWKPHKVCHLASMAGVRYSIQNPKLYNKINVEGFIHILEECRINNVKQLVYASSSSVYGLNKKLPFNEMDIINTCNSPYACSKITMEYYAKTYYQLYKIKNIGLRFFTVYGPRGRPDMAPFKLMNSILTKKSFQKYGSGDSSRDYTYIDDIVQGVVSSVDNKKDIKCEIYNLGNSQPISLNNFINLCEKITGQKALINQIENQLGDVPHTFADINKAKKDLNYFPKVKLEEGLKNLYEYIKNNID